MSTLKLTLLGSPTLERDGRPLPVPRRKARALLAYLAVTQQSHSRETLVAMFWPEYDRRHGRADLSRTLSVLRRTIGAGRFLTGRESVALNPQPALWVDVLHFRQQLDACRQAAAAAAISDEQLQALAAAVALYQADFLAGFTLPDSPAFDEWQLLQTEALRRDLGWALSQLARAYAARHDLPAAIASAQRWVTLDPLHEPAQRQLIELYARNGQRAEAHRQYQACVRLLAEELGVEPQAETMQLYQWIRQNRPLTPAPHSQSEPRLPAFLAEATQATAAGDPFIARARQLARLDQHLAAALEGKGGMLFVTGGAGRGKTALLSEFARRARRNHPDLIVAGGNCSAYAGFGDPYLPFREVMEMLTGDVEARWRAGTVTQDHARRLWQRLPDTVATLLEHGPHLVDVFVTGKGLLSRLEGVAPHEAAWLAQLRAIVERAPSATANLEQSGLFGQYTNVLRHLAGQYPLLLTLDDLQWADRASIGLLFHLGRRLAGSRILIVGAYRPDELALGRDGERHPLANVLDEFRRTYGDVWIDLAAADRLEGRTFVDAFLDGEPNHLDQAFRHALFAQTGGHPLFTVELLRQMQAEGALVQNETGRWRQSEKLDWQTMPARVEAVIAQRLDRLDDALRDILNIASVEGEFFTAEVIAHVQAADDRPLLQKLSQHLDRRHRLVRRQGETEAGGRYLSHYRFSHVLFQQYLYDQLSPGEQRRLHGAVATALATLHAGNLDEVAVKLAHHYSAAGDRDQAATYLVWAGDLSRHRAALANAAHYYQAALALWPQSDQAGRAQTLRLLGECLWVLGRHQEALPVLAEVNTLFKRVGDNQGMGAVQRMVGHVYYELGERAQALDHYRQALAILEQGPESVELAWALDSMSDYYMKVGRYDEAIEYGRQALALARRLGAEEVIIHCLCDLGSAISGAGDWDGLDLERESLERALAANRPHDACRAYAYIAEALVYLGRYKEARDTFAEGIAYGQRLHIPYFTQAASLMRVELDWLTGRWPAALSQCPHLVAWSQSEQTAGRIQPEISRVLAGLYNDLGQARAARDVLAPGLAAVRTLDVLDTTIPFLGELARAELALGNEAAAVALVMEMLEWSNQVQYLYPTIGRTLLFICLWPAVHEQPALLEAAHTSLEQLQRLDAQYQTPATAASFLEGQGWLHLAGGRGSDSIVPFEQAIEHWRDLGHPYDQARALSGLGQALNQTGDPDQAPAAFDRALELIESLAAQLAQADQKASFLESPLVRQIQQGRSAFSSVRV